MQPWQQHFSKFSPQALESMKTHSDNTHEEREWMCYVYEENGEYFLGSPSYGDESRIEVNPVTKAAQDATKGLTNKKYTIHGHPLKDGKIYTGRQYFSSTDILNEFIKTRDTDEYIVQWIVYPHQQIDSRTGEKVIHNRLRTLVFPDSATITEAMQRSNPGVDVASITKESGQNSNASDGSLQNDAGVNWFAFQDSLGELGYMGIMDLEGPSQGSREFKSEKMWGKNLSAVGLIAVVLAGLVYYNTRKTKLFGADIEVIDGVGDWHEN